MFNSRLSRSTMLGAVLAISVIVVGCGGTASPDPEVVASGPLVTPAITYVPNNVVVPVPVASSPASATSSPTMGIPERPGKKALWACMFDPVQNLHYGPVCKNEFGLTIDSDRCKDLDTLVCLQ
jgi:hypothetical protein